MVSMQTASRWRRLAYFPDTVSGRTCAGKPAVRKPM